MKKITEAEVRAVHARLVARRELDPHELGCKRTRCVRACEQGRCRCAGCTRHIEAIIDAARRERSDEEEDAHAREAPGA